MEFHELDERLELGSLEESFYPESHLHKRIGDVSKYIYG